MVFVKSDMFTVNRMLVLVYKWPNLIENSCWEEGSTDSTNTDRAATVMPQQIDPFYEERKKFLLTQLLKTYDLSGRWFDFKQFVEIKCLLITLISCGKLSYVPRNLTNS